MSAEQIAARTSWLETDREEDALFGRLTGEDLKRFRRTEVTA